MKVTRRSFLSLSSKIAGASAASLVIPITGCAAPNKVFANAEKTAYQDEGFIQILNTGEVHFVLPRDEMGQGIYHGLTTLIAEELSLAPNQITVQFAPVHDTYTNTGYKMQGTWGSSSIREHYLPLRQAAANARETLLNAASKVLNVERSTLTMSNGYIISSAQQYPLGEFVNTAASLPPVKSAPLTPANQLKFIGHDVERNDTLAKVTGAAKYGIDQGEQIAGLHRAIVIHGPTLDATLSHFDASKALASEGVTDVIAAPTGVAIVAQHLWQAKAAESLVDITWASGDLADFNSQNLPAELADKIAQESGIKAFEHGDGSDALSDSLGNEQGDDDMPAMASHGATYFAPYLAHMTMEPMNCIVSIDGERCDLWVGTQAPEFARNGVADLLGLARENVTLHNQFMGGGFGRRVGIDYILETAHIARQTGKPIQLVWSREEDLRNDYYRPPALINYRAEVDANGVLKVLVGKRAGPNIFPYILPEALPAVLPQFVPSGLSSWLAKRGGDVINHWKNETSSVEGLFEDYLPEHCEIRNVTYDPGIRTGYWRGVGHSLSGFFKESFIDELAHKIGADPVEFRLANLKDEGLKNTLTIAAKKANWSLKHLQNQPNRALGVAVHRSLKTAVAQIADVSVEGQRIIVHKVICVVDCGLVINPDIVKAQMEGGIIFGMSAALHTEVKFAQGQITQSNFHDYPIMRLPEAPEIEVHIVPSNNAPTGVGEPGLPPVAPAIANALFAATGQRLRSLPLRLST